MSNGTGAIGDYMFDDIRKLDFGSKFSKDFAGVTLPTVEEYLECMKKSDKLSVMNIEIKPNKSEREDIVRKTIEAVKDYGLFDELLISSFDYKMLVEAKKYDPKCKTAYLYPIYGQVVRRWFSSLCTSRRRSAATHCIRIRRLRQKRSSAAPMPPALRSTHGRLTRKRMLSRCSKTALTVSSPTAPIMSSPSWTDTSPSINKA